MKYYSEQSFTYENRLGITFIFVIIMKKVLLKKIVMSPEVRRNDKIEDDELVKDTVAVTRDIYWLFEYWEIGLRLDPIGGRFFDSIDELNEELNTEFDEKDVVPFDEHVQKMDDKWFKVLAKVNN